MAPSFDSPEFETPLSPPVVASTSSAIALITCDDPRFVNRLNLVLKTWFPILAETWDIVICSGSNLNCPDDYKSLPLKVSAAVRMLYALGYDGMWKIDDDSEVKPSLPRPKEDYLGKVLGANNGIIANYCSGGAYWLSRRSMKVVAEADPTGWTIEDGWVGRVLHDAGIYPVDSPSSATGLTAIVRVPW